MATKTPVNLDASRILLLFGTPGTIDNLPKGVPTKLPISLGSLTNPVYVMYLDETFAANYKVTKTITGQSGNTITPLRCMGSIVRTRSYDGSVTCYNIDQTHSVRDPLYGDITYRPHFDIDLKDTNGRLELEILSENLRKIPVSELRFRGLILWTNSSEAPSVVSTAIMVGQGKPEPTGRWVSGNPVLFVRKELTAGPVGNSSVKLFDATDLPFTNIRLVHAYGHVKTGRRSSSEFLSHTTMAVRKIGNEIRLANLSATNDYSRYTCEVIIEFLYQDVNVPQMASDTDYVQAQQTLTLDSTPIYHQLIKFTLPNANTLFEVEPASHAPLGIKAMYFDRYDAVMVKESGDQYIVKDELFMMKKNDKIQGIHTDPANNGATMYVDLYYTY